MYCAVKESPTASPGPVPVIRSVRSGVVGAAPGGTTIVGALPEVPAGDGSATGEKCTGFPTVVVVTGTVVVGGVVVVVGGDLPAKSRAPVPSTTTATMATMMPRRVFWRLFARFCIASILSRR